MNSFKYVFKTWLLSHLLHPFLVLLFLSWINSFFNWKDISILFLIGPVMGMPSLFISWFFLNFLRFNYDIPIVKLALWMLLVSLAIALNLFFILLFTGDASTIFQELALILPAVISSWVIIIIRSKQFENLFTF